MDNNRSVPFILERQAVWKYLDQEIEIYRSHYNSARNDALDLSYFAGAIEALENVKKELLGDVISDERSET